MASLRPRAPHPPPSGCRRESGGDRYVDGGCNYGIRSVQGTLRRGVDGRIEIEVRVQVWQETLSLNRLEFYYAPVVRGVGRAGPCDLYSDGYFCWGMPLATWSYLVDWSKGISTTDQDDTWSKRSAPASTQEISRVWGICGERVLEGNPRIRYEPQEFSYTYSQAIEAWYEITVTLVTGLLREDLVLEDWVPHWYPDGVAAVVVRNCEGGGVVWCSAGKDACPLRKKNIYSPDCGEALSLLHPPGVQMPQMVSLRTQGSQPVIEEGKDCGCAASR